MATIAAPVLRHVRKTIAFDGTSGNGLIDENVTIFGITGRVMVVAMVAYCSETLSFDTANTFDIGTESEPSALVGGLTGASAGDWIKAAEGGGVLSNGYGSTLAPEIAVLDQNAARLEPFPLSEDIVLLPYVD